MDDGDSDVPGESGAQEALRNAHLCMADANAVLNIEEGAFGDAGVEIPLLIGGGAGGG